VNNYVEIGKHIDFLIAIDCKKLCCQSLGLLAVNFIAALAPIFNEHSM
jgi:hypothetical protein